MPKVARLGDMTSHGGVIITGSPKLYDTGPPVARITDLHACPLHGVNIIVTGSPTMSSDMLPVARIGDMCACGAAIVTGSATTNLDG
jgi:uncharacterized Zn-binding protein involved in type VI secretion